MNNIITKVTKVLKRLDGSEVKIVSQILYGAGLHPSTDTYVLRRESPEHDWKLCSNKPHPDWLKMSIDDYVKRGRSEVLQVVRPGELLSVSSMLGKPMNNVNQLI